MFKKFLKLLLGLSIGVGFFMVVGIDRAPGADPIGFYEALVQFGIGLFLMVVGSVGLKFIGYVRYE